MTRTAFLCSILTVFLLLTCSVGHAQTQGGTVSDGIEQDLIDATVRISRPAGRGSMSFGSGTIFFADADSYYVLSNRHVALDRGVTNKIEFWNNGKLVDAEQCQTIESWFKDGLSKDVAYLKVPKAALPGEMPVVQLAPYGTEVKPGDKVIMVGCSDARWPRGRTGNVIKVENGLIYYEPESIGGDSGSAVFSADGKHIVGLTAWAIQLNGRWVGLAMTSNRVKDITQGRVSSYDERLPDGAVAIQTLLNKPDTLPTGAVSMPLVKAMQCVDGNCLPGTIFNQAPIHITTDWRSPFRQPPAATPPATPNPKPPVVDPLPPVLPPTLPPQAPTEPPLSPSSNVERDINRMANSLESLATQEDKGWLFGRKPESGSPSPGPLPFGDSVPNPAPQVQPDGGGWGFNWYPGKGLKELLEWAINLVIWVVVVLVCLVGLVAIVAGGAISLAVTVWGMSSLAPVVTAVLAMFKKTTQ